MKSFNIEILQPKVMALINDLAELKLIKINKEKNTKIEFEKLLSGLRQKAGNAPSLDEINGEVEKVRTKRYAR